MINVINKAVKETRMEDSRFLKGQGVVEAMSNTFEFGKQYTMTFDDGTKLAFAPITTEDGEVLLGVMEIDT